MAPPGDQPEAGGPRSQAPAGRQGPPASPPPYPPPPTPLHPPPGAYPPPPGAYPPPPGAYPPPPGAYPAPPGAYPAPPAARDDLAPPSLLDPDVPPRTKGDAGVWFFLALAGFVAGQVVALVFTMVAADIAGQGNQLTKIANLAEPPEWYVAASLIGLWCGFAGAPWLASRVRGTRRFLSDLGLRFRVVDLVGIAVGFGGQVLVGLMYAPFAQHLKHFNAPTQKLTGASHGGGFAVIALLTVLGAPLFEELFFRGLVFRSLLRLLVPSGSASPATRTAARTVGIVAAVALDGLLFGLAHGELVQLAGLAAFGMILAVVAYRTRRLGMNIVAHMTFNLVAIISVLSSRATILH